MIQHEDWNPILQQLSTASDSPIQINKLTPVTGGDIHNSYILITTDGKRFFIKTNTVDCEPVLATEAEALEAIRETQCIKTPCPFTYGTTNQCAYLAMEYLSFTSHPQNQSTLGKQVAMLHRNLCKKYGWQGDNYIGRSPQFNLWHTNWCEFWITQRLIPQLKMAYQTGFSSQLAPFEQQLTKAIQSVLQDHQPDPSLLHGDLWSGNAGHLEDGTPAIFDPASYYGDREADIAMTELFGGFSPAFYQSYRDQWPIDGEYKRRKPIYNLYHMLNHLNLFGGGYLNSCLSLINTIIHSA
ncbi:fructosamine kinase family protein [Teredinibacter sp. KSP-S5-2]|uniref:fructosamine kinase family protein n=1 Tax=Teredinibacter sp. KSP-S5-2 TaxID=3034506 RepID=UPI0029349C2D|nr:fructosamine kinase family protein [Teredinibacter sp. KSP-S5-2]WNO11042.1 fructosamine kinase family protein [Teredinibacter sp. KSP-S5-2]